MKPAIEATSPDVEADAIPIGATVRTPTGRLAKVIGHTGKPRGGGQVDPFPRLICRYLNPKNKRFDTFRLQPSLVEVVSHGT